MEKKKPSREEIDELLEQSEAHQRDLLERVARMQAQREEEKRRAQEPPRRRRRLFGPR